MSRAVRLTAASENGPSLRQSQPWQLRPATWICSTGGSETGCLSRSAMPGLRSCVHWRNTGHRRLQTVRDRLRHKDCLQLPRFDPQARAACLADSGRTAQSPLRGQCHHPCRGPRRQILRTRNLLSTGDRRMRRAGGGLPRIRSALLFAKWHRWTLSSWRRRRNPAPCRGYSPASRYCRCSMQYGVYRTDPARLPAVPCPIFWLALPGEIQQRSRRMKVHVDLIVMDVRSPGSSKGSARRRIGSCLPTGTTRETNLVDDVSRHLTRRANHRHIVTIARIHKPAPGNRPRAFSIRCF